MTLYLFGSLFVFVALAAFAPKLMMEYRFYQAQRRAVATWKKRFAKSRLLPLSRADKRGFATDSDGQIRPR